MVIKTNKGFTIIELIVFMTIIGIIAAVAFPNIVGLTDTSRTEVIKANMRNLISEIEVYHAQNDNFPQADTGEEFINKYKDDWNSLNKIVQEIGKEDYSKYQYDYNSDNYIFSVELPEGNFFGISKNTGLKTDLTDHLTL